LLFEKRTMTSVLFTLVASLLVQNAIQVKGHARLIEPPARNTLWRFDPRLPPFYDDLQLNCGGFSVDRKQCKIGQRKEINLFFVLTFTGQTQHVKNDHKCGICGEAFDEPVKLFEQSGSSCTNFTTRTYSIGSIVDVWVEISTNHGGEFHFEICFRSEYRVKGDFQL
jgi:hypothetical protein